MESRKAEKMISMDKKYRTRLGWKARIFQVEDTDNNEVIGAVRYGGVWGPHQWLADGRDGIDEEYDLIEVRTAEEVVREAIDATCIRLGPDERQHIAKIATEHLRESGHLREGE